VPLTTYGLTTVMAEDIAASMRRRRDHDAVLCDMVAEGRS